MKFNDITFKNKTVILFLLFLLFIILSYNLAIKKTIVLNRKITELKYKLTDIQDIEKEIQIKQSYIKNTEQIIGDNNKNEHILLMNKISNFCDNNNLILLEHPQTHSFVKNNFLIKTYNFKIEGNFIELLKLLYEIEQKYHAGKVISAAFYTIEDKKNRNKKLILDIYINNIKKNE